VIALWGPDAAKVLDRLFRNPRRRRVVGARAGTLLYGTLQKDGERLDEVVICRRGESPPLFEINCHGGVVPLGRVLSALQSAGCRMAPAREAIGITLRHGGAGEDTIRREAALRLPQAATAIAAKMLLDKMAGCLSNALEALARQEREARFDEVALRRLRALRETAPLGLGLCRPPRLAVVGKPNVGKSTLVNRLLAEERMIVHDAAGTTRDAVAQGVAIRGYPFTLVDTAGLGADADLLERLAAERAHRAAASSDLVLLVHDASRPYGETDAALARRFLATRPDRVVPVLNQMDRATALLPTALERRLGRPVVAVSALTGEGFEALEESLLRAAFRVRWRRGMAVVFTERQRRLLDEAAGGRETFARALAACLNGVPDSEAGGSA